MWVSLALASADPTPPVDAPTTSSSSSAAPLIAPTQSTFRPFGFGQVQVAGGLGMQFNGYTLPFWSLIEGWHPASVSVDLSVLNAPALGLSVGVETSLATQLLANPVMRIRDRFGNLPWIPGVSGSEANYTWRARDWMRGARLGVHLNRLPGIPFVLLGIQQDAYAIRATFRDDPTLTGVFRTTTVSANLGAGATSVLPSGLLVTLEARYILELAGPPNWAVPVGVVDVGIVRRMQPPPVVFRGAVGYRLGGRYTRRE